MASKLIQLHLCFPCSIGEKVLDLHLISSQKTSLEYWVENGILIHLHQAGRLFSEPLIYEIDEISFVGERIGYAWVGRELDLEEGRDPSNERRDLASSILASYWFLMLSPCQCLLEALESQLVYYLQLQQLLMAMQHPNPNPSYFSVLLYLEMSLS